MDITQEMNQGVYDIMLSGKFTFSDHSEFRGILQKMIEKDVRKVVLHMAQVEFVDSAALGMLLAADEAGKYQKQLVVSGATGQVKKMFDMARFNTLFTLN